ncbi:hypothetical protein JW710_01655 [Candidatus Dojkabacteria bacterium]|nr:hypothetical protein [Candidatus Dojkabacteria bacterium]
MQPGKYILENPHTNRPDIYDTPIKEALFRIDLMTVFSDWVALNRPNDVLFAAFVRTFQPNPIKWTDHLGYFEYTKLEPDAVFIYDLCYIAHANQRDTQLGLLVPKIDFETQIGMGVFVQNALSFLGCVCGRDLTTELLSHTITDSSGIPEINAGKLVIAERFHSEVASCGFGISALVEGSPLSRD